MRRCYLLSLLLLGCATTASAQTIVINPKTGMLPSPAAEQVRISLGINMFVPAPSNDSSLSLKAQEDGRKMVYQAAAQECDVLRATIAKDCTLESININVQYVSANQNYAQKSDGYNINGNINYRIAPK